MTIPFSVGGQSLDTLFASGSSGIVTGFKLPGGADVGTIFAAYTSGAKAGVTGFTRGGVDFKDLFQKLGSSSGLVARASPNNLSASGTAGSTPVTGGTTATASGGTGTYATYSWARTSGDATVTATSPTSATTTFSRAGVSAGGSYSAAFVCTVTDSASNSAATNPVTVGITGAASAFALVVSPTSFFDSRNSTLSGGGFSRTFTATPMSAAGAVTYAWTLVSRSGFGGAVATVTGTSTAAMTASGSWARNATLEYAETWRVDANDGATTASATISFTVTVDTSR